MATSLAFPTTLVLPAPSTDVVHFRVEVDRTRCQTNNPQVNARLIALENNGLSISIADLVMRAALHFAESVLDAGEGYETARLQLAWHVLMDWQLTAVAHRGNPKRSVLVVADSPNSRVVGWRTELLAFGIALEIGILVYDVAYPFWEATSGLQSFDLTAIDSVGNQIGVEARGRINRTNITAAKSQVHKKFKTPNFSQAAGVIFFPRTSNRGTSADILILDPDGDAPFLDVSARYRKLLRHFVPFFRYQGGEVRKFGDRLEEISRSSDEEFEAYLEHGDSLLSGNPMKQGRAGYTFKRDRYIGTFWKDIVWPNWLTGLQSPQSGGVFFWGLAKEVIDALQTGKVKAIEFHTRHTQVVRTASNMSVLLPDKTLLIWAPTVDQLDLNEKESL